MSHWSGRHRVIVGVAVLLMTVTCARDKVTGEREFSLVDWTVEQETAIGREAAPNIESQFDSVSLDLEAQDSLRELVRDLVSRSPRKDELEFQFKILNSSVPNAFALPGGYTYITRGLLARLETESQFVAIMGHELGHVEHRHAMANQSQETVIGVLTAPLRPVSFVGERLPVGSRIVGLATGIITAPADLYLKGHSRSQETEADERGVFFAAEMGFDPSDATCTFKLFDELEEESGQGGTPSLLRTHPLNKDRIKDVGKVIAERYPELKSKPADEFRPDSDAFQALLGRFRSRAPHYAAYDEAMQAASQEDPDWVLVGDLLMTALEGVPEEPLFHIAAGEIAMIQEDPETARHAFLHAVELYDRAGTGESHWKAHWYLGILDLEVDVARAVAEFRKTCELFPMHALSWFLMGQALERTADYPKAREAYEQVLALTDSRSEIHGHARKRIRALDTGQ